MHQLYQPVESPEVQDAVSPVSALAVASTAGSNGPSNGRFGVFRLRTTPSASHTRGDTPSGGPAEATDIPSDHDNGPDVLRGVSALCMLLGGTVRSVFAARAARTAAAATQVMVIDDDDDDDVTTRPAPAREILTVAELKARGCTCKESLSLYARHYYPRALEARASPATSAGQLWTERYMPTSKTAVMGNTNAVGSLANWLTQWKVLQSIENRDKKADHKRKKKKGALKRGYSPLGRREQTS